MYTSLVQSIIEIVFSGYLLYLAPILFLLMVILFADRLIDLISNSIPGSSSRRNRY